VYATWTEVALIGVKPYLEFVRQVIKPFGVVVTVTVLDPDIFENSKYPLGGLKQ